MRKFVLPILALFAAGLLTALPARAQAGPLVAGNVYSVTPNGCYIRNDNGLTFLSGLSASFYVHGVRVNLGYLSPGMAVSAYPVAGYPVQYRPVPYYGRYRGWGYRYWRRDRRGDDYRDRDGGRRWWGRDRWHGRGHDRGRRWHHDDH